MHDDKVEQPTKKCYCFLYKATAITLSEKHHMLAAGKFV